MLIGSVRAQKNRLCQQLFEMVVGKRRLKCNTVFIHTYIYLGLDIETQLMCHRYVKYFGRLHNSWCVSLPASLY